MRSIRFDLCCLCLKANVVLFNSLFFNMPLVAFGAGCLVTVLPLDLFIFVRVGFEPCNSHYLAAFVFQGPAISFLSRYLYLDRPFFSIEASC